MPSFELVVSTEVIYRAFIVFVFVSVGLISYWRLIPRLSSTACRLATAMFASHVLLFLWAMEWQPSSNFEHWLRLFNQEYNVQAMLAVYTVGTNQWCCIGNSVAGDNTIRLAAPLPGEASACCFCSSL